MKRINLSRIEPHVTQSYLYIQHMKTYLIVERGREKTYSIHNFGQIKL